MYAISSDHRYCKKMESIMTHKSIYVFVVYLAINISVGVARPPKTIVNGVESAIIPYLVSLQTYTGRTFCGGTILDARNILTAAHCVVNINRILNSFGTIVVIGTPDKYNRTEHNVFNVVETIIHGGYDDSDFHVNDIAVLKLDRNISFTGYVYPLQLPRHNTPEGTAVLTSGWGATLWSDIHQVGDGYPRYVRESYGFVVSQAICRKSLSSRHIRSGQICFWGGNSTPCNGDSGGPLTDGLQIIGITSFNENCDPRYPAVYTRVYHYLSWIKKAMGHL